MSTVLPITLHDIDAITVLAGTIWRKHYSGIISAEQIEYMLKQRYSRILIKEQVMSHKVWWKKLILDKKIIGFSCCVQTDTPGELKLDKLYIHPNHQCKGYGAKLVANAKKTMHENSFEKLILTVNKKNLSAVTAYQQYGFKISREIIMDIGNGYVMDDYLMTMTIQ